MCFVDAEVKKYFTPADFRIGATLIMNGRKFVLYDCDNFTKAWYYQHFGVTDFTPLAVKGRAAELPKMEVSFSMAFKFPRTNKLSLLNFQSMRTIFFEVLHIYHIIFERHFTEKC